MLSFQTSGEGLLVTAALLPAVLSGLIATPDRWPYVEGARSGALLALICYANAQAPALAAFVLLPAVVVSLARSRTDRLYALKSCAGFVSVFLLAVIPVLQILPGFGAAVQASQDSLRGDLLARLAWNSPIDFFTPYLIVGALPVLAAVVLLRVVNDVHPAERAAAVSLISIVLLWEVLESLGPGIASRMPLVALYKDFIKLQILMAVPFVILAVTSLRWVSNLRIGSRRIVSLGLALPLAVLLLLPVALGQQPKVMYITNPSPVPNGQALSGGQLGLPSWARVPLSYTNVLNGIQRSDPQTSAYRVLWLPIDWRLIQTARTTDTNLLLYWADGSPQTRDSVSRTFEAIVSKRKEQIAPLLAQQGVKYVVVDLIDGQDRNSEPWQKGPPLSLSVWGTQALVGRPGDYKAILNDAPSLKLLNDGGGVAVYLNMEWQPILTSYSGLLTVADTAPGGAGRPAQLNGTALSWKGYPYVHWKPQASDQSVRIEALAGESGQTPWAPVVASIPVTAGSSYRVSGVMTYDQVTQAHAKIVWYGAQETPFQTTYLALGHDGTGVVSISQNVVAPPGASRADIFLMGGWSSGPPGFTSFTNVTFAPFTEPDLTALLDHPERSASVQHELPSLLVELSAAQSRPQVGDTPTLSLGIDPASAGTAAGQIRLLTPSQLSLSGHWAINALPDPLAVERFDERERGVITVPREIFASAPHGTNLVWIEYRSGESQPTNGSVHTLGVSTGPLRIACSEPGCTIANVLLVPPLPSGEHIARFGYGVSPLLRTPDSHRSPVQLPGEWASIYSPPPEGYPSPLYDNSTVIRLLGLVIGHIAAVIGLVAGSIFRNRSIALR
jgi:hypothetical protein